MYTTVNAPRMRIESGITYSAGTDGPRMSATGIAVAKTRTESPKARVTMKVMDANRRVVSPNRRSSSAYAVTSSPWK